MADSALLATALQKARIFATELFSGIAKAIGMTQNDLFDAFPHLRETSEYALALVPITAGPALAQYIDHTLLKPDGNSAGVTKLCSEAKTHHFATVCVNSCWAGLAKNLLAGSDVKVCCVAGFPLGQSLSSVKAFEARAAVEAGAQEIDMVINVGLLKDRDLKAVFDDVKAVRAALSKDVVLKVILEVCLLTEEEIFLASVLCVLAGVSYIKTSTGFSTGGATFESVALMRAVAGQTGVLVKAAGGVRTVKDAVGFVSLGASRIGTSSGVALVQGGQVGTGY